MAKTTNNNNTIFLVYLRLLKIIRVVGMCWAHCSVDSELKTTDAPFYNVRRTYLQKARRKIVPSNFWMYPSTLSLSLYLFESRQKMKMRFTRHLCCNCGKLYAAHNCGVVVIHKFGVYTVFFIVVVCILFQLAFNLISFWSCNNIACTSVCYTIADSSTYKNHRTCDFPQNAINSPINVNYIL